MRGQGLGSAHRNSSVKGVFLCGCASISRVTGITQYIEFTAHVFNSGAALDICAEGRTSSTNEVCAQERGAGEGSLCPDLLGVPQPVLWLATSLFQKPPADCRRSSESPQELKVRFSINLLIDPFLWELDEDFPWTQWCLRPI